MSAERHKRGRGRPRGSSTGRHRIVPVWKQDFDREAFARTLLLLAMHLDEQQQKAHKKSHTNEHEGGGDHDNAIN